MADLICGDDLDLFGREMDDPVAELEQDLLHRLMEPLGSNPDDVERGCGLEDMLSGAITEDELANRVRTDFMKDERVAGVTVAVTKLAEGSYQLDIAIEPEGSLIVEASTKTGVRLVDP